MSPSVEEAKNALLKEHARQVKAKHPKWTFAQCWQAAQAANPELAEEYEGEATTASQSVFRYTEKVPPAPSSTSLREMLELPERVEA